MATDLITLVIAQMNVERATFPLRKDTLCHKNGLFSNSLIENPYLNEHTDI